VTSLVSDIEKRIILAHSNACLSFPLGLKASSGPNNESQKHLKHQFIERVV